MSLDERIEEKKQELITVISQLKESGVLSPYENLQPRFDDRDPPPPPPDGWNSAPFPPWGKA